MHPSSSGDTQAKASTDTKDPDNNSGSAKVVLPTAQTLAPISASDSQTSDSNLQSDQQASNEDGTSSGNTPPQTSAQNNGSGTIKSVVKGITGIKLR